MAEVTGEAIDLAVGLRNVGTGIAVLHGWHVFPDGRLDDGHPPLEEFHRLTRDLYVAAGDTGFWRGALRDPDTEAFRAAPAAIEAGEPVTVDLLYGDHEAASAWSGARDLGDPATVVARHRNIDRPDPR